METSFWVLGHRVDVLSYLFRFFTIFVPEVVRNEVLAPDPRCPQRVFLYLAQILSYHSAAHKLDGIASNTAQIVTQAARQSLEALAQSRGER